MNVPLGKRGENQCLLARMVTPCQGERLSSESRVPLINRTRGRAATARVAEGSSTSAMLVVRTARPLILTDVRVVTVASTSNPCSSKSRHQATGEWKDRRHLGAGIS